jgi:hypothetical protein
MLDAWRLTALHSATLEGKSFFVAWALLDQQQQQQQQQLQVQDQQHEQEETDQSQQMTYPFTKDPTKLSRLLEWKKSFRLVVGVWWKDRSTRLRSIELYRVAARCRPADG